MNVGPLIFEPIFKPKIWGGRRLETLLGKSLPPGEATGESWEVADLEDDQSVVAAGPARGRKLGELVKEWGPDLYGGAPLFENRFPLLIKFLDANDTLSLQVHPDEAMARRLGGRVRVKNEAWYVIEAEQTGFIYRGLNPGVDRAAFESAIDRGDAEFLLHRIPVRKGQCYYLPSGTVHALGAGVVVAEVQTPSDVTYRVFDWNRVDDKTGLPRELHIEQALECIDFSGDPIVGEERHHIAGLWTSVTRLVSCDSFLINRVRMMEGVAQDMPYQEMVIWMVLEGAGTMTCQGRQEPVPFQVGDTVLLPAAMKNGKVQIHSPCLWLEVSVPVPSSLAGYERPERERAVPSDPEGGGLAQINLPKGSDQS